MTRTQIDHKIIDILAAHQVLPGDVGSTLINDLADLVLAADHEGYETGLNDGYATGREQAAGDDPIFSDPANL